MKLIAVLSLCLGLGCSDVAEDDLDLSEVEAASTPVSGQGSYYQGSYYQGSYYQGSYYQGAYYQGSYYQGASYGGVALSDSLTVSGSSALVAWTRLNKKTWEQRFPNKVCYWNAQRTIMSSCTTVNPDTQVSPLAGIEIPATFDTPNGPITTNILIGSSSTQVGAVLSDKTAASHPLTGHTNAASCSVIPYNALDTTGARCDNPNGCRSNCDIWLYDLKLRDPNTNALLNFCANGEPATVVPGIYSATGAKTSIAGQFTFACTNGTIAKCTRWGYRPTGTARKYCNQPGGCPADTTQYPLPDYHQACVRAATADYCAKGYSFTKNGTLVDVYDYNPSKSDYGFLPKTRGGLVISSAATAMVWESSFDKLGAAQIDHLRYQELEGSSQFSSIDTECPGLFSDASGDILCPSGSATCKARNGGWSGPMVWIDSTPACSHSEHQVGKWLHKSCSSCTAKVAAYCTDPNDPQHRGWDANCVAQAQSSLCSSSQRMGTHAECTVGQGLDKLDSGCTLAVCLDPAYASCCNPASSTAWTSTCRAAASSKCKFAKNGGITALGLCDSIQPPPGGVGTISP